MTFPHPVDIAEEIVRSTLKSVLPVLRTVAEIQSVAKCQLTVNLSCDEMAPRRARAHAAKALRNWRVPDEAAQALVLVVSELTTNSVRHTESPTVSVTVALTDHAAWVGVTDEGGASEPSVRPLNFEDEGGRGLALVEAMASWWTSTPLPSQRDVVVAVALDAGSQQPAGEPEPKPRCGGDPDAC
ncbi:ATP-binding protein [Streptomyces sp. NPDC050400]|uniref:ATP-binding protein n=1 Tax=Streptomyces sp. NPDC050400 TaxID=3365610 RepID=UPI0037A3F835